MQDRKNYVIDLLFANTFGILPKDKRNDLNSWANESPENRQLLEQMQDREFVNKELAIFREIRPDEMEAKQKKLFQKLNIPT